MINVSHALAIIGVVAVCTFFLRAAPFVIFGGRKTVPRWIHYLGRCLPAAVMVTLVFYCLRGVNFFTGSRGIKELIALGLVIILHKVKKNILLTVAVSTVCYMVMRQFIFSPLP